MERISPAGNVYQAGTLSGNPAATSAGLATLEIISERGVYETLEKRSALLEEGLRAAAEKAGVAVTVNRVGSMLTPFFVRQAGDTVGNFAEATGCDTGAYAVFFHAMLERGIYLPPSQFEAWFVGLAHSDEDIESAVAAAGEAMKVVKKSPSQKK
jgi:glutamate-1-semialdehyde 2,1-aminomutase